MRDLPDDDVEKTLLFDSDRYLNSRLFSLFDHSLLDEMSAKAIQLHLHNYGVAVSDFYTTPLHENFRMLSYDVANGMQYVTSMEAYQYPIYAIMFHPEY